MPWFKVYVGRQAEFSASSFEKAKGLALPLIREGAAVCIVSQDTAEGWVHNPKTDAWELPLGDRATIGVEASR